MASSSKNNKDNRRRTATPRNGTPPKGRKPRASLGNRLVEMSEIFDRATAAVKGWRGCETHKGIELLATAKAAMVDAGQELVVLDAEREKGRHSGPAIGEQFLMQGIIPARLGIEGKWGTLTDFAGERGGKMYILEFKDGDGMVSKVALPRSALRT